MTVKFCYPWIWSEESNYQSYSYHVVNKECSAQNRRTQDKWNALKGVFPELVEGKTFLDIGAAQGFFCFKALGCGAAHATGVEKRESYWKPVQSAIEAAKLQDVDFLCLSFPEATSHLRANVVMALSLSHHLARNGMYFGQQIDELARLTLDTLLVEFIAPEDAQVDFRLPWYTQEVFEAAGRDRFRNVELIGNGHHPTRWIYRMDK